MANALSFEKRIAVFQWLKQNPKHPNGDVWTFPEMRDLVKQKLKIDCTLPNLKSICKAAKIETERGANNGFAIAIGNLVKSVDAITNEIATLKNRVWVLETEFTNMKNSLGG